MLPIQFFKKLTHVAGVIGDGVQKKFQMVISHP
jgi:hypothetical protein